MRKTFFGTAIAAAALLAACGGKDEPEAPDTPAEDTSTSTGVAIPDAPESPLADANKKKSEEFLAAEKQKDGVRELENGLLIETLSEGNGESVDPTDMIRFHFSGTLLDGTVLQDTRAEEGEPVVVPSPVVPGVTSWTEIEIPGLPDALRTMTEGERARVIVPHELAYGAEGVPGAFEPYTTLIFDLEVVEAIGQDDEARRAEITEDQNDILALNQAQQKAQAVAGHQQVKWIPMAGAEAISEANTALVEAGQAFQAAFEALASAETSDKPALREAIAELNTSYDAYAETASAYDEAVIAANQQSSEEFLNEVKARDGVEVTESGLAYEVLEDGGDGETPDATDTVTVHYTGTLPNGTKFDSSVDRGQPSTFPLNGVIAGWTEGVALMNVGDKYKFYIPAELAYGQEVRPGGPIGPDLALVFEVELLGIESPGDQGGQ